MIPCTEHTYHTTVNKQTHYNDVIMDTMASKIISLAIVYSTDYSGIDQRKHQSSTFPAQIASNAENVWWRHHVYLWKFGRWSGARLLQRRLHTNKIPTKISPGWSWNLMQATVLMDHNWTNRFSYVSSLNSNYLDMYAYIEKGIICSLTHASFYY